jgi:hypothetical protein
VPLGYLSSLFAGVDDIRILSDAQPAELRRELQSAVRKEQSLCLLLILLDPERSFEIREQAAKALDHVMRLVGESDIYSVLLSTILAHQLPGAADLSGAFTAAERNNLHTIWDLLAKMEASQPQSLRLGTRNRREVTAKPFDSGSFAPPPGYRLIFDGTEESYKRWLTVGRGSFIFADGAMVACPGGGLGLAYLPERFGFNVDLVLDFLLTSPTDDSSVFVNSLAPHEPVPFRGVPGASHQYVNQAWVPVHTGIEIKVAEPGLGAADDTRSGAVRVSNPLYHVQYTQSVEHLRTPMPELALNIWHRLSISARSNMFRIEINGQLRSDFLNNDPYRGAPGGFIGLLAHRGNVAYRMIAVRSR